MQNDPYIEQFDSKQSLILMFRQIQLAIGCIVLTSIIVIIIKRKQYVYNTTKLFMWCCVCYLIGMVVVLLHFEAFTSGIKFSYDDISDQDKQPIDQAHLFINVFENMRGNTFTYSLCGLQAFNNLFFYNVGYFFAILVTYNVYCVLTDDYRNFMRKILRNKKTWTILILMIFIYLLPWVLMYPEKKQQTFFYSYGPAGFKMSASLLLYCGLVSSPKNVASIVVSSINYIICPFFMLIYHSFLIIYNGRTIRRLIANESYLNSKQRFLLKSGQISVIVFLIQFLNFFKFALNLIIPEFYTILLILNFIFDFYPFVLLGFYLKYTKQRFQEQSSLLGQAQND